MSAVYVITVAKWRH